MSDRDDEVLARLRRADPAAGVEPDLTALRGEVDARRRGGAAVVDLHSRRRTAWQVAAVAAGAALLVGGYGLGRTVGESGPTAAPPITLGRAESEAGGDAAALDASTAIYPAPWSRHTTFRAEGLADEATTAQAWGYDATARFGPDQVTALGAALGLEGEPRQEFGAWHLGSQDGTGPSLSISPDGMTNVTFYDPTREPYRCTAPEGGDGSGSGPAESGPAESGPAESGPAESGPAEPAPEGDTGGPADEAAREDEAAVIEPLPPDSCGPVDLGPAPTGSAAHEQAREVLRAAGLDPAAFELTDVALGESAMTEVVAHHVVDGQRSGASWYFMLTGAGVQSFSGPLAPLSALGDYPVIGAVSAVARLTDPRFSDMGTLTIMREDLPVSADVTEEIMPAPEEFPTEPPAPVTAGSAVRWPVEEVVITGARLGLAQYTDPAGAAMLLPAYELSADDGRTWSVLAVAEEALDLAP